MDRSLRLGEGQSGHTSHLARTAVVHGVRGNLMAAGTGTQ